MKEKHLQRIKVHCYTLMNADEHHKRAIIDTLFLNEFIQNLPWDFQYNEIWDSISNVKYTPFNEFYYDVTFYIDDTVNNYLIENNIHPLDVYHYNVETNNEIKKQKL